MPRVQLDDLDLFYEEVGCGRTVLFLHGAFSRGAIGFGTQMTLLHRTCRGLYPDLRGHGRTRSADPFWTLSRMADDVVLFCSSLNLVDIHVVGYSMGGGVALFTALRAPELFASIATIGTAGCVTSAVKRNAAEFEPEVLERSGRSDFIEAVRANHRQAHGGDWKRLVRLTIESWRNEPEFSCDELARIQCPCLFMAGEEDFLVRPEHTERLARCVARGESLVLKGCGHGAHQAGQDPQTVHARLIALWEGAERIKRLPATAKQGKPVC